MDSIRRSSLFLKIMKNLLTFILITLFISSSSAQSYLPERSILIYKAKLMNSITGFAVGEAGTILKTTDGGETWIQILSGTTNDLWSLCFSNDIITVVGMGGIILKSTNGGTDWIPQNSGVGNPLSEVYFADSSNGAIIGFSIFLKTTNGGIIWNSTGLGAWFGAASFTDINTGTAAGMNGIIIRTTNGGSSWNTQSSGTSRHLSGVSFLDINNGIVVGDSGTILKTTNGGTDWIQQSGGTSEVITDVYFVDAVNAAAVGNGGLILKSTDSGINWVTQSSGTSAALTSIYFIDQNTGITAGSENTILKTTNGGITWEPKTVVTSVTGNELPRESFYLSQNYPNPFNPVTRIDYIIPEKGFILIKIYDALGREVTALVNELKSPGNYSVKFNGANLPGGIYFYRLITSGFTQTRKMILLK